MYRITHRLRVHGNIQISEEMPIISVNMFSLRTQYSGLTPGVVGRRVSNVERIFTRLLERHMEGHRLGPARGVDLQHPLQVAPSAVRGRLLGPLHVDRVARENGRLARRQVDTICVRRSARHSCEREH